MSKQTAKPVDVEIEQMLMELRVLGFAVAKKIAELRGTQSGVMACPLCQQSLRFSVSPSNGHMQARCSTLNCISIIE